MMTQEQALVQVAQLQTSKETAEALRHMAGLAKFDFDQKTLWAAAQQLDQYRLLTADLVGIVA